MATCLLQFGGRRVASLKVSSSGGRVRTPVAHSRARSEGWLHELAWTS